jgi:hypothetical protein
MKVIQKFRRNFSKNKFYGKSQIFPTNYKKSPQLALQGIIIWQPYNAFSNSPYSIIILRTKTSPVDEIILTI